MVKNIYDVSTRKIKCVQLVNIMIIIKVYLYSTFQRQNALQRDMNKTSNKGETTNSKYEFFVKKLSNS